MAGTGTKSPINLCIFLLGSGHRSDGCGAQYGANKTQSNPDTGNRKTKKPAYLLALIIGPDWPVREDSNLRPLAPRTYQKKTGIYTGEDKWYGVANVAMMPKK